MKSSYGGLRVCVDGRYYEASRLIWFWMTAQWPSKPFIDHRDGDRGNNAWTNLREATHAENNRNCRGRARSGFKGVYATPPVGRIHLQGWQALLSGHLRTPEEAHAAYVGEAGWLFGEFANFAMVAA